MTVSWIIRTTNRKLTKGDQFLLIGARTTKRKLTKGDQFLLIGARTTNRKHTKGDQFLLIYNKLFIFVSNNDYSYLNYYTVK